MLQIRLGADQEAPQPDPLGRARIGYRPGMTEDEAWEAGRGVWKLKADRVLEQRELQIIDLGGFVRAVGVITGIRKFASTDRLAVEGDLLPGDPRVGQPTTTPHPSRNSVAYLDRRGGLARFKRQPFIPDRDHLYQTDIGWCRVVDTSRMWVLSLAHNLPTPAPPEVGIQDARVLDKHGWGRIGYLVVAALGAPDPLGQLDLPTLAGVPDEDAAAAAADWITHIHDDEAVHTELGTTGLGVTVTPQYLLLTVATPEMLARAEVRR